MGVAVLTSYGARDSYDKNSRALITRPDDTLFIQNDIHTYRRTRVPAVMPPEDRSSKLGNIARRNATEGTMRNTLAQAQLDIGTVSYTEISRTLSEDGKAWLIEVKGPDGKTGIVSRLRSHKEGNGF